MSALSRLLKPPFRNHTLGVWRRFAFARFIAVGVLNTAFGYAVFLLVWLATGRSLAALAIATIAGVTFNFHSIGALVFNRRDRRLAPLFVAVYGFLFLLNAAALRVLEQAGVDPALAQALLTLPMAALSFVLNRRLVFNPQRAGSAA